jgi:hypothetical protein
MIKKLSLRYLYYLLSSVATELAPLAHRIFDFSPLFIAKMPFILRGPLCFTTATQRTQLIDLKPFVSFALAESNSLCPLFPN